MSNYIPGKIVIFDDDRDGKIDQLMTSFMNRGEACIFLESGGDEPETLSGVQIAIRLLGFRQSTCELSQQFAPYLALLQQRGERMP